MLTTDEIKAMIERSKELRAKMTDEEWGQHTEYAKDLADRMRWEAGIGRDEKGRDYEYDEDGRHWYEDTDGRKFRMEGDEKIYK